MSDHEKRIHDLLYSTESRTEMCERVVEMEELVERYSKSANYLCEHWDMCTYCELGQYGDNMREKCELGKLNDRMQELGIEVKQ